jgi:protein-disulfide isomerase
MNYSDLECPFCRKIYEDKTPYSITKKYNNKINIIYKHFPLEFHKNAYIAAEILECSAEQK